MVTDDWLEFPALSVAWTVIVFAPSVKAGLAINLKSDNSSAVVPFTVTVWVSSETLPETILLLVVELLSGVEIAMLGGVVSDLTLIVAWAVEVPLTALAVIMFAPSVKGTLVAVKVLSVIVADMLFTVTLAVASVTVPETEIVEVLTKVLFAGEVIVIESVTAG